MTSSITDDEFVSRFCVTKHSWKGKYTRIFCIGNSCVATINPNSIFKVTNMWEYICLVDIRAVPNSEVQFILTIRRGKEEQTTFSCASALERAELLTDTNLFRHKFDAAWRSQTTSFKFVCRKYRSSEEWSTVTLVLSPTSCYQWDENGDTVGEYRYLYIRGIFTVDDNPEAFVIQYGAPNKLHMFTSPQLSEILKRMGDFAVKFVGLPGLKMLGSMPAFQFDLQRLGVDRNSLASTADFPVTKLTPKHKGFPVRRVLSTTEKCILERDPKTYNTVSAFGLQDVFALIRCEDDQQKFMIEYKDPHTAKTYTSPVRDALLAHIVDACRGIGNGNVSVFTKLADRGKRAAPCRCVVADEIESTLLRCLIEPEKCGAPTTMKFSQIVEFFNANIEHNGLRFTENKEGLFAENREKLIFGAFMALLDRFPESDNPGVVTQQFYALRRLSVSRIGFASAAIVPTLVRSIGVVSVRALKMHNTALSHAVIDFLTTLMSPHHDNFELYHEQVNKNRMVASESFVRHLLGLLKRHTEQDSGGLVIYSLLDFLVYALCPPYSESTDPLNFRKLLSLVIEICGKSLYFLFNHSCKAVRYSAGMILRACMEEGDADEFFALQRAALSEGGFLRQFHVASFCADRSLRDLARQLVGLWTFENQTAQDLLRRMLPITLLHFLQKQEKPPVEEQEEERRIGVSSATQEWRESKNAWFRKRFHPKETLAGSKGAADEIAIVRNREINVNPTLNWTMLFYMMKNDHSRPDLIWNHNTRNELREALENEIQAFQLGLELRKERNVCWNYQEFEVQYPSLAEELRVGNHYPRLLFESSNPIVARPKEFFNDLYHRFLLVQDFNMKIQCLHGMSILYEHYADDIGQFHDLEFLIQMLEASTHPTFRDRMLIFLSNLLRCRLNVKPFIDCQGMKPMVDLVTLAHLHTDRPQMHFATNAIEAPKGDVSDLQDTEKEWHYTSKTGEKCDPVSFSRLRTMFDNGEVGPSTKVWAQGQGGWKDLKDVAQLKWGIIARGLPSVLNYTEVSSTILDIFMLLCAYYPSRDEDGSVMQPLPRIKRYLSDPAVLPHIVQLLLTFDPLLCSRVHRVLLMIMEDNPLMPRFFLTGVFFFALMYPASDIIPLSRLLAMSHRKQSFHIAHENEIIRSSILSAMLPPALVCFLHNHGPEKFAELFLGEYETPEAIWGREMRRYLIEKISIHIAEFTPRVMGNVRVVYQYCPIVGVEYEPLRNELFCGQYYLRHLCDEIRYPNWPIRDPVALMREVLSSWKLELEKKPTTLTRDDCLQKLEITDPNPSQSAIRKAYFRLAAIYHPDKNPTGREMFEAIQIAYTFLASETVAEAGPDPKRIFLLLRTQSILFSRHSEVMSKYKYAGYSLLLKLIQLEVVDTEMLTKEVPLMDPATELCFHTVNNAPINADELQQENGIELLSSAMTRCFELITPRSTDNELVCRIATNCIKTMGVAAQFPECIQHIMHVPSIAHQCSRGVAYDRAATLSKACIVACQAFCTNEELQEKITAYGSIWHLLRYAFRFDYTLEDSGVEANEQNHKQLFANRAAKAAFRCVYALTGYRPDESYLETKPNFPLHNLLTALLTTFIVKRMRTEPDGEGAILKEINSNHETPYFLWNNQSRAELIDFLEKNSEFCRDAGPESILPPISAEGFQYSAHMKELVVGGVFVRIYNEQPQYPLEDAAGFFQALVAFTQTSLSSDSPTGLAAVTDAMRNVIVAYPAVHTIAAALINILIGIISVSDDAIVANALDLLARCCAYPACIESTGSIPTSISDIIFALDRGDITHKNGLAFLHQLLTDRNCVQQFLDRGMYVVLLHIFASTRNQEIKEECCVCMAKATADNLNGPKVILRSQKLIPSVFLDVMKENPVQAAQMFETWQENPEIVWNPTVKDRVVSELARARTSVRETLIVDKCAHWKIPDEIGRPQGIEDVQIGGVYLERFSKQPNWAVRKPREFLMKLLEKFIELCGDSNRDQEVLDLVTHCCQAFLSGQPTITDKIVALGYIPKLLFLAQSPSSYVSQCSVKILHEVCNSRACVESMGGDDPVSSLMIAMENAGDDAGVVIDTLERLMSRSSEKANMVKLALSNKLITKLLAMLETGMTGAGTNAAASRAIVVRLIKTIYNVQDPVYGPQVAALLDASSVWWKYKDQSHDLFLTQGQFGGYITGPQAAPVLSLAAPPTVQNDEEPPPLTQF